MIWSLKHVCDTVTNITHETHKAQKSPKENQIMCQITYFFQNQPLSKIRLKYVYIKKEATSFLNSRKKRQGHQEPKQPKTTTQPSKP